MCGTLVGGPVPRAAGWGEGDPLGRSIIFVFPLVLRSPLLYDDHMENNVQRLLVTVLVASLTTSCATKQLWKATDPDRSVILPESQVSEAELQERGAPYLKDDHGMYHIGKTGPERFGDHALRFALTPAALAVDLAPYAGLLLLGYLPIEVVDNTNRDFPFEYQSRP